MFGVFCVSREERLEESEFGQEEGCWSHQKQYSLLEGSKVWTGTTSGELEGSTHALGVKIRTTAKSAIAILRLVHICKAVFITIPKVILPGS